MKRLPTLLLAAAGSVFLLSLTHADSHPAAEPSQDFSNPVFLLHAPASTAESVRRRAP